MPSNQTPLGALPARFRRERLLIVGCGDVGMRVAARLQGRMHVLALSSSPERLDALRAAGTKPLAGNLDLPGSLRRLAGLADRVLHLAPPPEEGRKDLRSLALLRALALRSGPHAVVYGSTSGVYGDCAGHLARETRAARPRTPRAQRRADAEQIVRFAGRRSGWRASILRIPGIYATDRPRGTPRERLLKRTPVLRSEDDVYTNHIHADDLARACIAALFRGRPQRIYNVNDDSMLKMGDYFDLAADLYRMPRPPRIPRSTAQDKMPLLLLSFMSESRRMDNGRMKRELRVALRHPTVESGLV